MTRFAEVHQALVAELGVDLHSFWASGPGLVGDIAAIDLDDAGFVPPGYTVIPDARCAYRVITQGGVSWPKPMMFSTPKRRTATKWF